MQRFVFIRRTTATVAVLGALLVVGSPEPAWAADMATADVRALTAQRLRASGREFQRDPDVGGLAPSHPPRRRTVNHRLSATLVAFFVVAAGLLLVAPNTSADGDPPAMLTVDDDMLECPQAQYATIQAAVDDAATMSGTQTIRVCPGTYSENVMIGAGNSLDLRGDGATKVFLSGISGTSGPIVDVSMAGKVSVRGITVDGMSALAGAVVWGIRFSDTSGEIRDVRVLHVRDASGSSQGIAIRAQAVDMSPLVTITHNFVRDYTRVGISANGEGLGVLITQNTVIGPDAPKVWAPNGIQVSRGATGRVEHNRVSGSTSPVPEAGAGSGILLFCAGVATVKENRVSDSDLGIALADNANATVVQNRVQESVFDAYSLQYIGTLFGDLGCPMFPSPTNDNALSDNRARNSGENGISFANFDPTDPKPPANNTVAKNDIRGSGVDGIAIFDGTDNLLIRNRIQDSEDVDARDETSGSGTAGTANTWQDNRCDDSSPDGLCRDAGPDMDWHSFGTAENAKDPKDPENDVVVIDTTYPANFGAVTRDLNSKVADLTGHLSVDYYIVPVEVSSDLPLSGGAPVILSRGCGGGPPRFELAMDLDGDGSFDGDAVGYIGPAPTFTGCAQNEWQHQDLTDAGLRWDLTQLGGLPLNTWADVLAFFAAYPNHKVLSGTLVDDSVLLPVAGGVAYYDNVVIGGQTLSHVP